LSRCVIAVIGGALRFDVWAAAGEVIVPAARAK
jgi:hypothetical protein